MLRRSTYARSTTRRGMVVWKMTEPRINRSYFNVTSATCTKLKFVANTCGWNVDADGYATRELGLRSYVHLHANSAVCQNWGGSLRQITGEIWISDSTLAREREVGSFDTAYSCSSFINKFPYRTDLLKYLLSDWYRSPLNCKIKLNQIGKNQKE